MILRCTAKVFRLLGERIPRSQDIPSGSDDWYLNLLWTQRRKSLLLVHAGTLFPVFVFDVRVRDLRPIGPFVVAQVEQALQADDLPSDWLGTRDLGAVRLAKTADRRVLGVMNDMARGIQYQVDTGAMSSATDVAALNHFLRRGLHYRDGDYVRPIDLARGWDGDAG